MLTRSLCCFEGVTREAERRLWRSGCLSWQHLKRDACRHFSIPKASKLLEALPLYEAAFDARVADFFIGRLPCGHKLRIMPEFLEQAAFLDIETTGLDRSADITIIGVWRQGKVETFVRGRNMSDFLRIWPLLGVVVTFNGTRFDLPKIMHEFGLTCAPPHIDLLPEAKANGFVGGLKKIEQVLGYERSPEESGDGKEAVRLWSHYAETGNADSLKRLIAYNTRDVLSLVLLAKHLWHLSAQSYDAPHAVF